MARRIAHETLVVACIEEELRDREFGAGILLARQNDRIIGKIRRLGVALRERSDANAEVAHRRDELHEFVGVRETILVLNPRGSRAARRIPAQRENRANASGCELVDDRSNLIPAGPDAGEVRQWRERGLGGNAPDDADGAVARGSASTVRHRDQARAEPLEITNRLPKRPLTVIGLRREQFEGEGPTAG
ncbi:unannotated protein [freshwater metagenome]|uniref:Unannotated protein n=1 Tax=freshwater metagenome TaxID=449393 RepID=A0A6J6UKA9_9ZZZZ